MTRLLDQAALFRDYPHAVCTDNGPEFANRAFMAWTQAHGIRHLLIQPGQPMRNDHIESINGKFRDECLSEHWFETLPRPRVVICAWRQDQNEVQPPRQLPADVASEVRRAASVATRRFSATHRTFD